MKTSLLTFLARVRLLRPTYRAYERFRALGGGSGPAQTTDVFPLPPATLRVRVAGNADAAWFLEGGRLAEESIRGALGRAGTRLEDFGVVLDFGCGCGRVTRRLANLPGDVRGSDFDPDAVAWCRRNLPFARFEHNGLGPPLSYAAESVDFTYAFSVLTHLPVPLQHEWMEELARIVRPGGLLLFSTHGESYLDRLTAAERATFTRGGVVVRYEQVAGTNLCTAFHPRAYVEQTLARGWDVIDAVPEGATGSPHQDLFLLRKP